MAILRPNIAMDAPPTSIDVGGFTYTINTDYRVWIGVLHDLRELLPAPATEEEIAHNAVMLTKISMDILFGKPMKWETGEQIAEFLQAVSTFASGYPSAPIKPDNRVRPQTFSFEHDINPIVLAFKRYYGEDISYTCESYHWWIFLEKFQALCGDDLMILKLMEIRGYTGKDEELKRQASRFAIPHEQTASERLMMSEINDEFYGAH